MLYKSFEPESQPIEVKSSGWRDIALTDALCGVNMLSQLGLDNLTANVAWRYYKTVDPILDAVDYLATECSEIELAIYDTKDKVYIEEVDPKIPATLLLKLLDKPNVADTRSSFIYKMVTSLAVTGDIFVVATGIDVKKPPRELHYHGKQYINIIPDSEDGLASVYQINKPFYDETFKRDGMYYRFYNVHKDKEIRQIAQQFNPDDGDTTLFGMSKLRPLYYQMEQHIQGNIHNYKLLANGARPSGALIMSGVSNEAKNEIKEQVQKFYTGSQNSGSVMALSVAGGGYEEVEFKELSINNKDMDFAELKKMAEKAIYKIFKIPSSFYDNTRSTSNNMSNDTYRMYDFGVLPMMKQILAGLNDFLMPRYDDTGRYELGFVQRNIPALELRFIDVATKKIETGLMTIPEGRNSLGLSEWDEKDPLYSPKQGVKEEVPKDGSEPDENPVIEEVDQLEADKEKAYREYHRLMTKQGLDDAEIKQLAIEEGLL